MQWDETISQGLLGVGHWELGCFALASEEELDVSSPFEAAASL
jgi:hypothetical protein